MEEDKPKLDSKPPLETVSIERALSKEKIKTK